jgi:alpha,alpha-trehalase
VRTLAGVFPLAFGLATPAQAKRVATNLQYNFLKPGGLVTTLSKTGQQWDAPNGWAPLQYLAIEGLRRYEQRSLADTIARRWVGLNRRVFAQTGQLLEKVRRGEPQPPRRRRRIPPARRLRLDQRRAAAPAGMV